MKRISKTNRKAVLFVTGMAAICMFAPSATAADKSFVGAWEVIVSPDFAPFTIPTNATVTSDETIISADPTFGSGHGIWEKVGSNKFAVSFTHIFDAALSPFPATQGPHAQLTVSGLVTIDASGEMGTGPFITVFRELSGSEIGSFTGIVSMSKYSIPSEILSLEVE